MTPITHFQLIELGFEQLGEKYKFPEVADTVFVKPHYEDGLWVIGIDEWCLRTVSSIEQLDAFYFGMTDKGLIPDRIDISEYAKSKIEPAGDDIIPWDDPNATFLILRELGFKGWSATVTEDTKEPIRCAITYRGPDNETVYLIRKESGNCVLMTDNLILIKCPIETRTHLIRIMEFFNVPTKPKELC